MKFRPLVWQNTHPYLLCDRMEDITDPEQKATNPQHDRKVCIFGYVRGTHLKPNMLLHIPGCGDVRMHSIGLLPDPCPPPEAMTGKRHKLNEKERIIYAPMSDVGGVLYDQDATVVDIGAAAAPASTGQRGQLLQDIKEMDLRAAASATITLFPGSAPLKGRSGVDDDDTDSTDAEDDDSDGAEDDAANGVGAAGGVHRGRSKVPRRAERGGASDDDDDDDYYDDGEVTFATTPAATRHRRSAPAPTSDGMVLRCEINYRSPSGGFVAHPWMWCLLSHWRSWLCLSHSRMTCCVGAYSA